MPISEQRAYGAFHSPIGLDRLTRGNVAVGEVRASRAGVFWLELRPAEQGRSVLCRAVPGGRETLTADGRSVRTLTHEYGGAAYAVQEDRLFTVDFEDQRIYSGRVGSRELRPITPAPPRPRGLRYADLVVHPDGRRLFAVRESHGEAGVVNDLVEIPTDGGTPRVVAAGADFYAAPRVDAEGERLAWLCWDHPQMPWDGTRLLVAGLRRDGGTREPRQVAGGTHESICQPEFDAAGDLCFVSDRSGFWNLYREPSGRAGRAEPLAPLAAEFGRPHWAFGSGSYAPLPDGRLACVWIEDGREHFGTLAPGERRPREIELGASAFGRPVVDPAQPGAAVVLTLASFTGPGEIARVDLDARRRETLHVPEIEPIDPVVLSTPEPIRFATGEQGEEEAHALYYAPRNDRFRAPPGERPPLVVMGHGGPTGAASRALRLGVQLFTSRGLAVVDVDYRGSTGYGRAYRDRLRGGWGVVDVEDCANAARALAARGLVDPERLAIRGGSAGGYTTLCALTFHDVFDAGVSLYGIADVEVLAAETHKFESRYLDGLIGPYPERRDLYRERSPIHFTDRLSCPLLLLQGLEDAVVPPSQAERMVAALEKKGLPYAYLPFEGEQHGFRRAETQLRAAEAELFFYGAVFGFRPADAIRPIEIRNLPR